ncbi:uncharacterized protein LOC132200708 [Neocloeon triangulifer]|uniref:uncharacterized protein LOC132200708 n=1 Tax=Neocloeon triangulifer TaxID=2078957 RepID=UPI00286EE35A|nr:uncharacterized protein LOC132200708 [Neocloeon triangulifer]XP_059482362.1 uncharacterized protein LOC132200708 [Neocloeon triangulifer]
MIELAKAADEFLLHDLGILCSNMLKPLLSPNTVWSIFGQNQKNRFISEACKKFLEEETDTCLNDAAFLEIGLETLISFLNLNKMRLQSEAELVSACVRLAKAKGDDSSCSAWLRLAIPQLHLFTVPEIDLLQISEWLTNEERIYIAILNSQSVLLKGKFALLSPKSFSPICGENRYFTTNVSRGHVFAFTNQLEPMTGPNVRPYNSEDAHFGQFEPFEHGMQMKGKKKRKMWY